MYTTKKALYQGDIMKKKNKGFTLIEMLVVVLIIGILAGIALPQYQSAVFKAKVASILPMMKRWKDSLIEYKLMSGSYFLQDTNYPPNLEILGINFPNDWNCSQEQGANECRNSYWTCSDANTGRVSCCNSEICLYMFQADDEDYEMFRDKIICWADFDDAYKKCAKIGKLLYEDDVDKMYAI